MQEYNDYFKNKDKNISSYENESNFVRDIIDAYAFANKDFYSEAMNWAASDMDANAIKQHIYEDLNISISLAEAEAVLNELSSMVNDTPITAAVVNVIPIKTASLNSFDKISEDKYKCKFAEVYWQVKKMDWNGEEKLCLVRIEE